MAYRYGQIGARIALGTMALAVVPGLVALLGAGIERAPNWDYLFAALRFTLWQALLSTLLSAGLGMWLALGLFHRQFKGREWLLKLFAVPQSLPPLVAAFGLLALFGARGLIPGMPSIYGLSGILLAHVFFNLPFAARLFLSALEAIPNESLRLSQQLGMKRKAFFKLVEWPVLKTSLPGVAGLIFMLCLTSFTLVLTLGGGPKAATLEVVIYQALRFDYDPGLALSLALAQLGLCLGLMMIVQKFARPILPNASLGLAQAGMKNGNGLDLLILIGAGIFISLPLLAVVIAGLQADIFSLWISPAVMKALFSSFIIALCSSLLAVGLSIPLALDGVRGGRVSQIAGQLPLLLPPVLLAAGWFLLSKGHVPWAFVVLGNGLMALPFAMQALHSGLQNASAQDQLCAQLGIEGLNRFRLIDLPQMRASISLAFLLAMMVSFGDLGVIAFFGGGELITLPYLLYQKLGSYRSTDAEGLALLLFLLAFLLAHIANQLARKKHA